VKNDHTIGHALSTILEKTHWLEKQFREGQERDLFVALSDIEMAAHLAQKRLNDLRFRMVSLEEDDE
jgi:hypothetical protein